MSATRIEQDSLGTKDVSRAALFGIQTVRAVENFHISGIALGQWPDFIKAFALVEKSCALCNLRCGHLRPEIGRATVHACDPLADNLGRRSC